MGSSEAYFFLTTSIPTLVTVIMTVIAALVIVIVFLADYLFQKGDFQRVQD